MSSIRLVALAVTLCVSAACQGDGTESSHSPSKRPATVTPTASATPVSTPTAPAGGPRSAAPSATCVHGWRTPPPGSERWTQALDILHRATGAKGPFVVIAMRYFEGPESPPSEDKGYLLLVRRWYVKAYLRPDPAWRGRFLVEQRTFGSGVSAVAPFDSTGFDAPDWKGFQYDVNHPPTSYPGLPGEWAGIPYDFVNGGAGLTIPGLPDEVAGCMSGS